MLGMLWSKHSCVAVNYKVMDFVEAQAKGWDGFMVCVQYVCMYCQKVWLGHVLNVSMVMHIKCIIHHMH
jgi:hypothetical protein